MTDHVRTIAAGLVGAALLTGCVTKSTFRREMNDRRGEIAAERTARVQADSGFARELESLRTDLQGLRTEFGAKITAMEEGMKFALPVNFGFDDASLGDGGRPALDRFATVAGRHYAGSVITIEGFADPAGPAAYNVELSRRRAEAVRDYLVSKGLDAAVLRVVGYGEARQVVRGAERDEPGAAQNRRVVFVVESAGGAAPAVASGS